MQVIEEKYYWLPQMKINLDWAELALNEGMDAISVTSYVAQKLFERSK